MNYFIKFKKVLKHLQKLAKRHIKTMSLNITNPDISTTDFKETEEKVGTETKKISETVTDTVNEEKGDTPLHSAIKDCKTKSTKNVIHCAANINAVNDDRDTPLHLAIRTCKPRIAELLIDRGAHINAPNNDRDTPLHLAIRTCQPRITELLIERGALINAPNNDGDTPLHLAIRTCQPKIKIVNLNF